ncbi:MULTISPECIES: methionyl-tRNA formyltransferase-like protein [Sinorhizobium]|uniref:Methionyl-tRNA formyltransferase-like protein n=1 Tax=Sinorhizobium americanum TaxID=194963 RepID=A0A2S3YUL0_9HYPH|nr:MULTISPECIES: methionyl-tRNA formyltransferase-like protein [Sinorhizobium]PDT39373.1 methionyl-tRNA formyltransferase-like protein [Sinorhizobium sp. FG01]PDT50801.1 methionyl-tRNA formyltransferase-like protein [Sinorhizobium sp. NG07B]POH34138.1 hypothetical protein ATY30_00570 [Sinorhizobium americanum]POH35303.1 hypothetical protein ATY31_03660 [Sinorhizobium americanum]
MQQLNEIIATATRRIEAHFFNLPVDGGGPVYRERVYCYELYHQLRIQWPTQDQTDFVLNGEVDKRGHPILHRLGADMSIPDLLVHVPGYMGRNHAVIEVKPGDNAAKNPRGIAKDLATLSVFQTDVGYERGVYLFYGSYPERIVRDIANRLEVRPRVEVWLHHEPGQSAALVDVIGD